MAFFSKKKKHTLFEPSAAQLHTVSVDCPNCKFTQTESELALSTFCRACSAHYNISKGKAIPNKPTANSPFASLNKDLTSPKLRNSSHSAESGLDIEEKKSSNTPPNSNQKGNPRSPSPSSEPVSTPSPSLIQKAAASAGFLQSKEKKRELSCFECDKVHQVLLEASSSQCPSCGAYIALKNYEIQSNWNQRIQTRGDVVIQKKAVVTGITIQCHHLTAHGDFTGNVDCSGSFTLKHHAKIAGEIRCNKLIIEKKAIVEFTDTVHCHDAVINGSVTGNFKCTGKLSLQKKSTLTGDIHVVTMAIEEGAQHHGRTSIGH